MTFPLQNYNEEEEEEEVEDDIMFSFRELLISRLPEVHYNCERMFHVMMFCTECLKPKEDNI